MNIASYSIIYKGLFPEPVCADAAAINNQIWAAASGNTEGSAAAIISSIEEIGTKPASLISAEMERVFARMHLSLQETGSEVSVAGTIAEDDMLYLFNIGNARVLLFKDGYMQMHTDDHSEAYEEYRSLYNENTAAYDQIRSRMDRLTLTRSLGGPGSCVPQFYTPVQMEKNMAFLICTERFWQYISVTEMELDYRKAAGPEEWLKIMSRRVLMKSNHELDEDNFAAAAAMIEE